MMLAQTYPAAQESLQQIHEAIDQIPGQGLQLLFYLVVLGLIGIIVTIWRQQRLAANQLDLARMIEQLQNDLKKR